MINTELILDAVALASNLFMPEFRPLRRDGDEDRVRCSIISEIDICTNDSDHNALITLASWVEALMLLQSNPDDANVDHLTGAAERFAELTGVHMLIGPSASLSAETDHFAQAASFLNKWITSPIRRISKSEIVRSASRALSEAAIARLLDEDARREALLHLSDMS